MQTFNQIERVYAGFWARAAAFVIDCILVWFLRLGVRLALFLSFGLFTDENPLEHIFLFQYTWKDSLLYAAGVLYFVLCTYYAGATLGKKALNLCVVSEDGEKLTFVNVLFRETAGRFLSAFVLGLGYLLVGITNDKKALHDMLCDTRVIYAKKIPVYINGEMNKRYTHYEQFVQEASPAPSDCENQAASSDGENQAASSACGTRAASSDVESQTENCGVSQTDIHRKVQAQVFEMPPAQETGVRRQKSSIYDRYMHIEPGKEKEKED